MANDAPLPRLSYAPAVTVPEALPQKLGRYRLARRLGVGGMAETFVAFREDAPNEPLCIKKVLPAYSGDASFVAQFQREATVAGELRHPNVVGLFDFGAHEGELFMVMELVEGVDLSELLQAQPSRSLPLELAALVVHDVALGLGHAHARSIVHRDVTPSNVLLGRDGRVKLADFGVAKALTSTTAATATGFLKGKVPYMAPEYIQGHGVTPKVDLFSLGVVLYEVLAGRRPFVGTNDVEVMMRLMTTRAAPLTDVPPDLAELVARLLDRDPEARPGSGEEVASALTVHFDLFEARKRLVELIRRVTPVAPPAADWSADQPSVPRTQATPRTAVMGVGHAADDLSVAQPDRTALDLQTPFAMAEPDEAKPSKRPWRWVAGLVGLVGGALLGWWWFQAAPPSSASVVQTDEVGSDATAHPVLEENLGSAEGEGARTEDEDPETEPPVRADDLEDLQVDEASSPVAPRPRERTRPRRRVVTTSSVPTNPSPEPPEPPTPSTDTRPTEGDARLHVVVVPWGFVWVDGRRVGRSPVSTTVSAGVHTIRAGFDGPTVSQRIEVPRGATRRLELVIED